MAGFFIAIAFMEHLCVRFQFKADLKRVKAFVSVTKELANRSEQKAFDIIWSDVWDITKVYFN